MAKGLGLDLKKGTSHGRVLAELFKERVEPRLIQPTFITHYPTDISPLSRRNAEDPDVVDRFELFIAGREIANGFSELNDPMDQRERFLQQLRERSDEADMVLRLDEDFLHALEFGMPPTAGEGIGIDRLVMLLADAASIREVIFFPLLRMEK
jgi:lysyl-tRNA synthetase class 2